MHERSCHLTVFPHIQDRNPLCIFAKRAERKEVRNGQIWLVLHPTLFSYRHKLPEVPFPTVCQVQPLSPLLHWSRSEDLHLQLLEWWETSRSRVCTEEFDSDFCVSVRFSIKTSPPLPPPTCRPSSQRPVCEQQWLFGSSKQWKSQSKCNRSAHCSSSFSLGYKKKKARTKYDTNCIYQ